MKKALVVMPILAFAALAACRASAPGKIETLMAEQAKKIAIGGKDWKNPVASSATVIDEGRMHFQHHCQICHGNDGHNTGVPFAEKMSPPVADLGDKDVQEYSDGQLKWIVENGIKMTGMPGWKGILEDDEMWKIVHFIRHLPAKGSAGVPAIYKEEEEEHKAMHEKGAPHTHPGETHEHKH
ncbi:MAG TPA: c-type cytochrome [Terriglobales bacterium]|nr:c-type cytochrome [Terriglobales bacterium]